VKKMIRLTAAVLVLLLLAGCASQTYKYVEKSGSTYVVLSKRVLDRYDPKNASIESMAAAPEVRFSSISEMKNDIKTGNFSEEEIGKIACFSKDTAGNIEICNIDNLFEPTFPTKLTLDYISWRGSTYCYFFNDSQIDFCLTTQERANYEIDREFVSARPITEHDQKETFEIAPDVSATAYYFNYTGYPTKDVHYSFVADDITYYVRERYDWGNGDPWVNLIIIGVSNSQSFIIYMQPPFAFWDGFSVEEISQIGLKKYVETEVS